MSEHALVGRNIFLLFKLAKFEGQLNRLISDREKDHWEELVKISKEMEKYILKHYKDLEKIIEEEKTDLKFVNGEWKIIRGKKK